MRIYHWKEENTFMVLPYVGFSWRPGRPNCVWFGWFCWMTALFLDDPREDSYIHTHHGEAVTA
jgi:hypothetical protein